MHPLVVDALTEHIGEGLERAVFVGEVDSAVSILAFSSASLGGPRPRLNRQTHLHLGVSRHGEAVQAVGDDSAAGPDEKRYSVGLGPECFEGPSSPVAVFGSERVTATTTSTPAAATTRPLAM